MLIVGLVLVLPESYSENLYLHISYSSSSSSFRISASMLRSLICLDLSFCRMRDKSHIENHDMDSNVNLSSDILFSVISGPSFVDT